MWPWVFLWLFAGAYVFASLAAKAPSVCESGGMFEICFSILKFGFSDIQRSSCSSFSSGSRLHVL